MAPSPDRCEPMNPTTPSPMAEAHRALPLGVHAVADARRFALRTLVSWRGSAELTGSVVLIVSELVTNAVLYGYGAATLLLRCEGPELVVEVADRSPVLPAAQVAHDDSEIGRGLQIVAASSRSWGVRPDPATGGKVVWSRLAWLEDDRA